MFVQMKLVQTSLSKVLYIYIYIPSKMLVLKTFFCLTFNQRAICTETAVIYPIQLIQ